MPGFAGRRFRPTELALAINRTAVLPDLCFLANDLNKDVTLNGFQGRINKKMKESSKTTICRPEMTVKYNVRMDDSLGSVDVHWIEKHA